MQSFPTFGKYKTRLRFICFLLFVPTVLSSLHRATSRSMLGTAMKFPAAFALTMLGLLLVGCGQKSADSEINPGEESPMVRENRPDPGIDKPDFSAAAADPKYKQVLREVQSMLASAPQPLEGEEGPIPGGFSFDVPEAKAEAILDRVHTNLLARGVYLFRYHQSFNIGGQPDKLGLLPTTNRYEVMAVFETNGANYNLYCADVIAWLKQLETTHPFVLTGIGFDFLEGYFTGPVSDAGTLAKKMYKFCPDIVDQGVGSVDGLAKELKKRKLYFWWD